MTDDSVGLGDEVQRIDVLGRYWFPIGVLLSILIYGVWLLW